MDEKQLLKNILVSQALIIAEQIRLKDKSAGSTSYGSPDPTLKKAVEHIAKHHSELITMLREEGLL
jgi:hypothetical protein